VITKLNTNLPRFHEEALARSLGIPYEINSIQLSHCTLNYFSAGAGPTLLLLHGANFGWGVWYPNIPALAKKFRVIALDLPGSGRSQRVDYASLQGEDLFATTEEFVSRMGLTNFAVIGCSIGGWLALKLALKHKNNVRAVVLENAVGFSDYMNMFDKILASYSLASVLARFFLRPHRNNRRIELFLRNIFADKKLPLRPEFLEYFYETMATSHNLLFISRLTAITKTLLLQKQLGEISQPVCVIWGASDSIMPITRNQPYFTLLPNMKALIYENTGHIPSLESPNRFNSDIIEFLETKLN